MLLRFYWRLTEWTNRNSLCTNVISRVSRTNSYLSTVSASGHGPVNPSSLCGWPWEAIIHPCPERYPDGLQMSGLFRIILNSGYVSGKPFTWVFMKLGHFPYLNKCVLKFRNKIIRLKLMWVRQDDPNPIQQNITELYTIYNIPYMPSLNRIIV